MGRDTPTLPETLDDFTGDPVDELHFSDGTSHPLTDWDVLAVWVKYGRSQYAEWCDIAEHTIEDYYDAGRYPARFSKARVTDDDTMADIAEDAIYYGDLRATKMQIGLASIGDDDGDSVSVVTLTDDGSTEEIGGGAVTDALDGGDTE